MYTLKAPIGKVAYMLHVLRVYLTCHLSFVYECNIFVMITGKTGTLDTHKHFLCIIQYIYQICVRCDRIACLQTYLVISIA